MKKTLSLLLVLAMVLGSFSFAFADEAKVDPAVEAGEFLKKAGVLEGSDSGDLMLDKQLKRQDAVVLLSRLMKAEEEAKKFPVTEEYPTFKDITNNYYKPYLAWAQANKYYEGHNAEKFGYGEFLTAQQYATVLLRALGYEVNDAEAYKAAFETAKKLGIMKDLTVEEKAEITRGQMAQMTFNALGLKMKGSDKTLAEFLGIEMPVTKPTKLTAKVKDTENLAEVVVELSNVDLVKNKEALTNPANYRLSNDVKVQHVDLDGDNVILTLVPYGKVEKAEKNISLIKGKKFHLTIRNIDPAINDTYYNIVPGDNAIPVVEDIQFIGTHGIKVVTSEPIANPLERNFRLDSRTSMIVEQYGRNIILTPYHGKEFDKAAVELTIDGLKDFAGYTSVRTVEKMEISSDEGLPKVEAAYRSGKELVVVFDKDVYHDSIKAYESRRELGNVSFVEKRVPFYAEKAEKINTNTVKYTFTRDIPRNTEITIEGVANHFNKAMEKQVVVPVEYKDDYAPEVIDFVDAVEISKDAEKELAKYDLSKDAEKKAYNALLDKGYKVNTQEMEIAFDKDIAQFENAKPKDIEAKINDYFTLYELDITRKGETAAEGVKIHVASVDKDKIELTFEGIKINNKDRDYDYILEVRNLSDANRNRMERDYLDFQVVRIDEGYHAAVKDIKDTGYFNRDGVEIVLEFSKYVNKEEASNNKNYYLDGKAKVDEAIVERDGKTVSLVVYDITKAELLKKYEVLEISPNVKQLDWPYARPVERFFELKTGKALGERGRETADAITYIKGGADKVEGYVTGAAADPAVKFNLDATNKFNYKVVAFEEDGITPIATVTKEGKTAAALDVTLAELGFTGGSITIDEANYKVIVKVYKEETVDKKDYKLVEEKEIYTVDTRQATLLAALLTGNDAKAAVPAKDAVAAKATIGKVDFEAVVAGEAGNDIEVEIVNADSGTDSENAITFAGNKLTVTIGYDNTNSVQRTIDGAGIQALIAADSTALAAIKASGTEDAEVATGNLANGADAVPAKDAVAKVPFKVTLTFTGADLKVVDNTKVSMVIGGTNYADLDAKVIDETTVEVTGFADSVKEANLSGKLVTSIVGLETVNGEAAIADGTVTLPTLP